MEGLQVMSREEEGEEREQGAGWEVPWGPRHLLVAWSRCTAGPQPEADGQGLEAGPAGNH